MIGTMLEKVCPDRNIEKLAYAVLGRAVEDYLGRAHKTESERRDAMLFLTDKFGESAEMRVFWCSVVNICPDKLRSTVIRLKNTTGEYSNIKRNIIGYRTW